MGQSPTENNGTLRRHPWGELGLGCVGGYLQTLEGLKETITGWQDTSPPSPCPNPRLARALKSGEGRLLEPKRAVATGEG